MANDVVELLASRTDSLSINGASTCNASEISLLEGLTNDSLDEVFNYAIRHNGIEWQTWPGELSDLMAWSAQFLDQSQTFHFNTVPTSGTDVSRYTQVGGYP
jgi:hypothetical protein